MPRLRRLSGREVIQILSTFGFQVCGQKGSHVKLRRSGPQGERQTLTVPDHRELDTGACRAILRQAARCIPDHELQSRFFSQ